MSNKGIAEEIFEHFLAYDWPGNIRELQQAMEHVFANAVHHSTIFAYHLPEHFRMRAILEGIGAHQADAEDKAGHESGGTTPVPWREFKTTVEREYILALLAFVRGDVAKACRVSGLSRSRLYQLINQHRLAEPHGDAPASSEKEH